MQIQKIFKQIDELTRNNSQVILTVLGVSGTITTAYLTGKAAYRSAHVLLDEEINKVNKENSKEVIQVVWKLYIPPVLSGTATIACMIAATKIGTRRTAALTAAYSLSEKALSEYRDKIVETVGKNKEKQIRDEIAQEKVISNPPAPFVIGSGTVLCCDLFTGRYFNSDMESLRKAQNDINAYLVRHDRATLSHFYDLINLPHTSYSWDVGWTSDRFVELQFSTVLSEDNKPCIAYEFNYTKPV